MYMQRLKAAACIIEPLGCFKIRFGSYKRAFNIMLALHKIKDRITFNHIKKYRQITPVFPIEPLYTQRIWYFNNRKAFVAFAIGLYFLDNFAACKHVVGYLKLRLTFERLCKFKRRYVIILRTRFINTEAYLSIE